MSMNNQSKPAVRMALAVSTVLAWRRPTPIASWSAAKLLKGLIMKFYHGAMMSRR